MLKVAAYITAYQDKEAIQKCLACIFSQTHSVDRIFVIDNSPKLLDFSSLKSEKIIIEHHPENIGISGGLSIGIEWAIENKYDFLWTFDQDSEPLPETLETLIYYYKKLNTTESPIGIIAPLSIDIQSNQELEGAIWGEYKFVPASVYKNYNLRDFYHKDFYECDIVITSGSLVNLEAAKNVESPNKELFIDAVDWDYCMKMRSKSYCVVVVAKSIMYHNFGSYKEDHLQANNLIPIYTYSALRYYYTLRNHTFVETRLAYQSGSLHLSILFRIKALIKKVIKILLYDQEKVVFKIYACIAGTIDGIIGNLGKKWT
jgi:rhamnosyltransferase